ncbi:MAG: prepilin-type N-terminal cleavage/methylation domain-containing protein [Candidatus Aminicenantes bacterium]|nr:prepilin-type N-terminal cleavage/methylation domain-containing protein [Candidatus Aminicenantes bacterium]
MRQSSVRRGRSRSGRGFTFIEIMVVVSLIGLTALAIYPSINNIMRTRTFDNAAKDILTTMQQTKHLAVRAKISHRIRFLQRENIWRYVVEHETADGNWVRVPGQIEKTVPPEFAATVSLPAQSVTFSALGYVTDFTVNQNTVTLQSERLTGALQDDLRVVSVYAGGLVRYARDRSF